MTSEDIKHQLIIIIKLRNGFRSDGSDLGTAQASYGSALGLAKAQHVEQKPCTDSRSESRTASSA